MGVLDEWQPEAAVYEKGRFAAPKPGAAFCPSISHGLLLCRGLLVQNILVARGGVRGFSLYMSLLPRKGFQVRSSMPRYL